MKKLVALLAVLMFALTACGESAEDKAAKADAKTAKANLSKNVLDQGDTDSSPFDEKAADCFADKVVDDLGVKKLQKYGILDSKLEVKDDIENTKMSATDAGKAADAIADCVDFDKFFAASFAGEDTDPKIVECLKEAIDKETFRDLMKATFQGDTAAVAKIAEPAQKCALQGLPETPSPSE